MDNVLITDLNIVDEPLLVFNHKSKATFTNTTIQNSTGRTIVTVDDQGELNTINSSFINNGGADNLIEITSRSIYTSNGDVFRQNYVESSLGSLLYIQNSNANVTNVAAYTNTANIGGFIATTQICDLTVTDSLFVGNSASFGGVIYMYDNTTAQIDTSHVCKLITFVYFNLIQFIN